MIPPNAIIPYDGTHAGVPNGWSRDTRFDGKFIKGASSGFGDTGGSNTHTHVGTSHTHVMNNHTHTMTLYGISDSNREDDGGGSSGTDTAHTHWGSTAKTSTAMQGGNLVNTVAYPSSSNVPPFYKFIFIKANTYTSIPESGIVFRTDTTRQGFEFHADSAGKHIAGSTAGQNAGETDTGAATHTHNLVHTHTAVNHSHTGATLVDYSNITADTSSANKHATSNHSHILYWHDVALSGASSGTLTSASASNLPLAVNINVFKALGAANPTFGDIILTTETTTPVGYRNCDGAAGTPNLSDYYIRNQSAATSGTTTTGSNTHTHAASNSHSHGTASHAHTGSTSTKYADGQTGAGSRNASRSHYHYTSNLSTNSASWTSVNVGAAESVNNEPPYIKVKFIQFRYMQAGAGIFGLL